MEYRSHKFILRAGASSLAMIAVMAAGSGLDAKAAQLNQGGDKTVSNMQAKDTRNHNRPKVAPSGKTQAPVARHVAQDRAAMHEGQEETISVSGVRGYQQSRGGGMMRRETATHTTQTVTRAYIDTQSPSSSMLDLVRQLPSVNVSSADPGGMFGGNMSIRGLTDADMSLLMNGAPAASAYYMEEDVDSENLSTISITPGSADLDTPSTTAAAGVLEGKELVPGHSFDGKLDFSYGSFNLDRQFGKISTGDIGQSGIRGYVSFSHTREDNWRGPGVGDKKHVDVNFRKDIGRESYVDFIIGWNHQFTNSYKYPTAAQFYADKDGRQLSSPINYTAEYSSKSPTSFYNNNIINYDRVIVTVPMHFQLTNRIALESTIYYTGTYGNSVGGTSLTQGSTYSGTTKVNVGLSSVVGQSVPVGSVGLYDNPDVGVISKIKYDWDHHHFTFGYWFDNNADGTKNVVLPQNGGVGGVADVNNKNAWYKMANGKNYYTTNNWVYQRVNAFFIQQNSSFLSDKLTVGAGLKLAMVSNNVQDYLPGDQKHISKNYFTPLPQVTLGYRFNGHHQIYINAEGDFRAPGAANITPAYSTSTGKLTYAASSAKPQYSIKEELGYRYSGNIFLADISLFNYNITNRLLSLNTYVNSLQVTQVLNAGNQTTRGVDVMLSTRPIFRYWSPYASFEYLHGSMDSNIQTTATDGSTDYLRTKGKVPVQTPHVMANLALSYDDGHFFGNAGLHFVSSQYSTFMNDQKMPAYISDTLALGYRFGNVWRMKGLKFQLNASNLTGAYVRSGVRSFSTNALATTGVYGNAIAASSSSTYYIQNPFSISGTISTNF